MKGKKKSAQPKEKKPGARGGKDRRRRQREGPQGRGL